MEHNLQDTISLVGRTPVALDALLRDMPDVWTLGNEGQGTWSAFEVVGHLIQGDRTDWIPRAKIILQFGEARAFDPFDMSGYRRECQGKSLSQLLDDFADVRSASLLELRAMKLGPEQLALKGRHPSLGIVTLSQLLATWVAHDLTHVHQISRLMAHQYREAVGPWDQYLGVMQCAGHSSR
jgi:DinB superfamily